MDVRTLGTGEGVEQASDAFVSEATRNDVFSEQVDGVSVSLNEITFEPGQRTKYHTHTHGQILYVTDGEGLVGTENERVEVAAGDAVFFPPGENHWHGAKPDTSMTHLSITVLTGESSIDTIGEDPSY